MNNAPGVMQFEQFVEYAESTLDAMVENGSDQELFVASYLHGHFSLVVSQVEQANTLLITALDQAMQTSLNTAFGQNELEEQDQSQVRVMWQKIVSKG